jgi:hypothetical protein
MPWLVDKVRHGGVTDVAINNAVAGLKASLICCRARGTMADQAASVMAIR